MHDLLEKLQGTIRSYGGRVVVAFSGGVDSTVVAKVATLAIGAEHALCVAAHSESNTEEDIALCRAIAAEHGLSLEVVSYSEIAIPNYAANPANRCYFCKSELYDRLTALAAERGYEAVLDGSNADDAGDYRPGMQAVAERRVRSPLRECGITKQQVRDLAQFLGLPNHDKPSSPCLSSRIPYGQAITSEKLQQVAAGERFLRTLGLREFRCRHHGEVARLEVPPEEFPLVLEHREAILAEFKRIGFLWTALDLKGFQSGGLNALLAHLGKGTSPDSLDRPASPGAESEVHKG